jgi:hypothetical protein
VVIVDQIFKRFFYFQRAFELDPLQVADLVYIFPPEYTKQRAGFLSKMSKNYTASEFILGMKKGVLYRTSTAL